MMPDHWRFLQQVMPMFALSIVGVGLLVGGWSVGSFLRRVISYQSNAKGAAIPVTDFRIEGASEEAQTLKWFVIDDQVMGGRSSSAVTQMTDGSIKFAGIINTKGGGFSSCRTLGDDEPMGFPSDSAFVDVMAVPDGRQYKLTLHTADSWRMSEPTWTHDFHADFPGVAQTFRLALKDFVPSKQGRPVQGAVLDPSRITGVGVNLSLYTMDGKANPHFGDGPFRIVLQGLEIAK
jgi:hypothetical protein